MLGITRSIRIDDHTKSVFKRLTRLETRGEYCRMQQKQERRILLSVCNTHSVRVEDAQTASNRISTSIKKQQSCDDDCGGGSDGC